MDINMKINGMFEIRLFKLRLILVKITRLLLIAILIKINGK